MRMPLPGPRDVLAVLDRAATSLEQLLAAVPRTVALLDEAQRLLGRVDALVDRIESTRSEAEALVRRTDGVVTEAQEVLTGAEPLVARLTPIVNEAAPSLERLLPTLDRLAETTDPQEVDALVALVDMLPVIATRMETDIVPVLQSLNTVAPDLHDLLDVSRELNQMLGSLPRLGRIKKRVDDRQLLDGRG